MEPLRGFEPCGGGPVPPAPESREMLDELDFSRPQSQFSQPCPCVDLKLTVLWPGPPARGKAPGAWLHLPSQPRGHSQALSGGTKWSRWLWRRDIAFSLAFSPVTCAQATAQAAAGHRALCAPGRVSTAAGQQGCRLRGLRLSPATLPAMRPLLGLTGCSLPLTSCVLHGLRDRGLFLFGTWSWLPGRRDQLLATAWSSALGCWAHSWLQE